MIDQFIDKTFVKRLDPHELGENRVLWFKNRTRLQSIKDLEHFHVLVKNASPSHLLEWTGDIESRNPEEF